MVLQAQRPVLHGVRGEMLLRVHRLLHLARPDRAVDVSRHHHAHPGQQLHQPRRHHRLQRRLVLLLPQRRSAGRRWLHPLGRGGEVQLQRRRHHPDDQYDDGRGAAGRHARSLCPPGSRDHRVGQRYRNRTLQRGRDERQLDRKRRLHQGQGRRIRHRCQLVHRQGGLGGQRRPDRAAPGQYYRANGRDLHCVGHRRLADLDHGLVPCHRCDRDPRSVPALRRWQRVPVQYELVAVHHRPAHLLVNRRRPAQRVLPGRPQPEHRRRHSVPAVHLRRR